MNLVNAKQMSIDHPDTFYYPEQEDLDSIKPGDTVKICNENERFWVEITEVNGENLKGRIDNNLIENEEYDYNDIVNFTKDNVYDIWG